MSTGLAWHTSSYSYANGNCVQVAWRKASASTNNGHCVEVGWNKSSHSATNGHCAETTTGPGLVYVRDSKNPDGPKLTFTSQDWAEFTAGVRAGKYAIA